MRASLFSPFAVSVVLLGAVVAASACAPVLQNRTADGGPPLALPSGVVETARISTLYVTTGWVDAEADFIPTFTEEVEEELNQCAWGAYPLDARIHVESLRRDGRVQTVISGEGRHSITGVIEFTDPARGDAVVGRYPIQAEVRTGGGAVGLFGDRQMMASEAFGRAICDSAFGRNPRRSGPQNATAD